MVLGALDKKLGVHCREHFLDSFKLILYELWQKVNAEIGYFLSCRSMAISDDQKLSLPTQVVSSKEQPVLVDLVFTL